MAASYKQEDPTDPKHPQQPPALGETAKHYFGWTVSDLGVSLPPRPKLQTPLPLWEATAPYTFNVRRRV
jgi:hypothetical protein